MIKVKIHQVAKDYATPVTAKFDSTDTFHLFLSFAKDGMKEYISNMSEQSNIGSMYENVNKYIHAIEQYEADIQENGYFIEGKARQLIINF